MNIFTTIQYKYQGETIFCFVCVATVFGYILGVNKVIDAIITKHSDEMRAKVVQKLNKYTQTNLSDLAELLASKNIILSHNENDVFSSEHADNNYDINDDIDTNNNTNDVTNETNNETSTNLNDYLDKQEKKDDQCKQMQENAVMSPSSTSSTISTSEEDYELVKKNENNNHLKNKKSANYFEWLNIF